MEMNEPKKKTKTEYIKQTYQTIALYFRYDSKLNAEVITRYAKSRGESLNSFIVRAFEETIRRDGEKSKAVRAYFKE